MPKKKDSAFDPENKVMWNTRVHAGVQARFNRLSQESGLTLADLLTLAVVEVEKNPELKALIVARRRASAAVTQEDGVKAVLARERAKMRRRANNK